MSVTGIAASHTKDFDVTNPTDMIYLYEVDGLRIAHFGDMGQEQLTADQLKKLGKINILFTRFSNVNIYSAFTEKTLALIKQIKPAIALALHFEPEVVDEVLEKLNITERSETEALVIDKKDIASIKGTQYVFLK